MLKIRRPLGCLIFNMGIAIPGKTVFLIETAPRITRLGGFQVSCLKDFLNFLIRSLWWYTFHLDMQDTIKFGNSMGSFLKIVLNMCPTPWPIKPVMECLVISEPHLFAHYAIVFHYPVLCYIWTCYIKTSICHMYINAVFNIVGICEVAEQHFFL